jgi:hypothetical protein
MKSSTNKQHRVRSHRWHNGRLETKDYLFEEISEAIEFAKSFESGICKVFNHLNEILFEHGNHQDFRNTYA